MAREIWLRPNRRVFAACAVAAALLLAVAIGAIRVANSLVATVVILLLLIPAALLAATFLLTIGRPRLAYQDGCLLVYLRPGGPDRVPIELVECFFLGQGDSLVARPPWSAPETPPQTSTVVVRLAESAESWKHVRVPPALGHWCDGYITIRGTWCEPLGVELLQQLNARLVAAHREVPQRREKERA